MQRNFMERRRKDPSYLVPIVFSLMEILMMWLILSLFNWAINPIEWNIYAYAIASGWAFFSCVKLRKVLKRQKVVYD